MVVVTSSSSRYSQTHSFTCDIQDTTAIIAITRKNVPIESSLRFCEVLPAQKKLYEDAAIKQLVLEMHTIFDRCRTIVKLNGKLSTDETLSISRGYRSIIRSTADGYGDSSLYMRDFAMWSLFEAMFFKAGDTPIFIDLVTWAAEAFSFVDTSINAVHDEIERGISIDQGSYWKAVAQLIISCRFDTCIELLKLQRADSATNTFVTHLSKLNIDWICDETKSVKVDIWKRELKEMLTGHAFKGNDNIRFLVMLLTGDEAVIDRVAQAIVTEWWHMMPIYTLIHNPQIAFNELGILAKNCFDVFNRVHQLSKPSEFDPFLSVFNLKDVSVLQNVLSNPWLSVHLVDTMHNTDSEVPLRLFDIRRFTLMDYGEGLVRNSSLWEVGADYLIECGSEGRLRLENLIEAIHIEDDAMAEKLLRLCVDNSLDQSITCIINTMTFRYLRNEQWSAALSWALKAGKSKALDTAVQTIVWRAKESDIAEMSLLEQLGDLVLLSPALSFLFSYYRFHKSLNNGDIRVATQVLVPLIVSPDVPSSFHKVLFSHLIVLLYDGLQAIIPREIIFQLLSFFEQYSIEHPYEKGEEECEKVRKLKLLLHNRLAAACVSVSSEQDKYMMQ